MTDIITTTPKTEKCKKCGKRVSNDPLSKVRHIYEAHTLDFAKLLLQSPEKMRMLGEQAGRFIRENFRP